MTIGRFYGSARAVWDDDSASGPEWFEADIGLEAWATVLVYRSRLLMFDFRQQMFALFDGNGSFRTDRLPLNPLGSEAERQAVTMQLAVEVMARRSVIRARIDTGPYNARLIYDTLYYVSVVHDSAELFSPAVNRAQTDEDVPVAVEAPAKSKDTEGQSVGEAAIKLTPARLREYLRSLSSTTENARDTDETDAYLRSGVLYRFLVDYLRLLEQPTQIRMETIAYARSLGTYDGRLRRALADSIDLDPVVEIGTVATDPCDPEKSSISFRFLADRYGYRIRERRQDLTKAIAGLRKWQRAVHYIFEDLRRAWELAVDADLTPRLPRWPDIEALVVEAERLGIVTDSTTELADASTADFQEPEKLTPSEATAIASLSNRAFEMRKRLQECAEPLQLGLLFALLASAAAPGIDDGARRLIGLKTVGRLFRPDLDESWTERAERFREVPDPFNELKENGLIKRFQAIRKDLETQTIFSFDTQPDALEEWAGTLRALPARLNPDNAELPSLGKLFWEQWDKTHDGRLERRVSKDQKSATSIDLATVPTVIDILHTAAHQGIPVVPTAGEKLSIAQLSRIRLLHKDKREEVPEEIATFALEILVNPPRQNRISNSARASTNEDVRSPQSDAWPVVLISLLSADSPAWSWTPEPGIPASVLLPKDVLGENGSDMREVQKRLFENVRLRAGRTSRSVMSAIEADDTQKADDIQVGRPAFFGYGEAPGDTTAFFRAPLSLRGLLVHVQTASPEFFARGSFWKRLWSFTWAGIGQRR